MNQLLIKVFLVDTKGIDLVLSHLQHLHFFSHVDTSSTSARCGCADEIET